MEMHPIDGSPPLMGAPHLFCGSEGPRSGPSLHGFRLPSIDIVNLWFACNMYNMEFLAMDQILSVQTFSP